MFVLNKRRFRRITRRSIRQHTVLRGFATICAYLGLIIGLHIVAMMHFEGMSLADATWLTFTTATTVGYGDYSAKTDLGRLSTIVLMFMCGIFLLAQAAGLYFEVRSERRERRQRGYWSWIMQNHVVIINAPAVNATEYFQQAISQLRSSCEGGFEETPIILLTEAYQNGLPPPLTRLGAVLKNAPSTSNEAMEGASVASARSILVIAEQDDNTRSDALTLDIVMRLRDLGVKCPIVAEVVNDENRQRIQKAGATSVIRPIRGYPEMAVRALIAPGSEQIIEEIFNSGGGECIICRVEVDGLPWKRIVTTCINHDVGLALAFQSHTGEVICNPHPDSLVVANALFILVREDNSAKCGTVQSLLQGSA